MNKRQQLINQVKIEYAQLADYESRGNHVDMTVAPTPEAYYEQLLGQVISQIESGMFDNFSHGREIVEAVANNHHQWGINI